MSSKLWFVHIVLVLYIPAYISARDFSALQSFKDAVNILREVCDRPLLCGGETDHLKPYCCGYCMCAENCLETGICCLDMYDNFAHLTSVVRNKRYSCLLSQFLPYKDTQFSEPLAFVVFTGCDREYKNDTDRHLCETPVSDLNNLEAIVPVTEPVTDILYKNKYCAYCNNIHKTAQLINWKLRINSNQYIPFPRNDLLEEIRKARENIMFVPPVEYITRPECMINSKYTIETCNQTGLWAEHNTLIETACESTYIDSFNYTYKNFFCFLCNEDISAIGEGWIPCGSEPWPNHPGFSAVYDLKVVMDGQDTNKLVCNDTQFADEEMRLCREILCYDYRFMYWGKCVSGRNEPFSPACVSVFMKLTPLHLGTRFKLSLFYKNVFKREIENRLEALSEDNEKLFSQAAQTVELFFKTNDDGHNEYFVVYIESFFETAEGIDQFLEDVILLTETDMLLGMDTWKYSVGMAQYELIVSGKTAKLLVPNTDENSFDELINHFNTTVENLCLDKETVPSSKLSLCPHIELNIKEIPMRIELDFLLVFDKFADNKIIKKLSRWEYEIQAEVVKICFKDYIIIKNAMARSRSVKASSSKPFTVYKIIFAVFHFSRYFAVT